MKTPMKTPLGFVCLVGSVLSFGCGDRDLSGSTALSKPAAGEDAFVEVVFARIGEAQTKSAENTGDPPNKLPGQYLIVHMKLSMPKNSSLPKHWEDRSEVVDSSGIRYQPFIPPEGFMVMGSTGRGGWTGFPPC